MADPAYEYKVDLVVVECGCCHMSFGMPRSFYRQCKEQGTFFRCPNPKCGWNKQHYTKSDNQKLEQEIDRLKSAVESERRTGRYWRNESEINKRRAAAHKGQVTKVKRRVSKGVCPCCNRTFQNLARHMESQHPAYGDAD